MKYLGKITDNKDLITKEYADSLVLVTNNLSSYTQYTPPSENIGAVQSTSGYIIADNNMYLYTDFIDVSKYASITYSRCGTTESSSSIGMAFYSNYYQGAYISGEAQAVDQSSVGYVRNNTVIVPSGAKYARFSVYADTSTYGYFELILNVAEENAVPSVNSVYSGMFLNTEPSLGKYINLFPVTPGFIIYYDGTVQSSSNFNCTDYIDLTGSSSVSFKRTFTNSGSTTGVGMAFYDSTKTYISGIQQGYGFTSLGYFKAYYTVAVPSNAKYARFSTLADTSSYGEFDLILNIVDQVKIPSFNAVYTALGSIDKVLDTLLGGTA